MPSTNSIDMATITKDMTFPKGTSHAETRTVAVNQAARARGEVLTIRPTMKLGGFSVTPIIEQCYDTRVIKAIQGNTRETVKKANPELVSLAGTGRVPDDLEAQIELEKMFHGTYVATWGEPEKGIFKMDIDPVHTPKIIAVQSVEDMEATAEAMENMLKATRAAIAARKSLK